MKRYPKELLVIITEAVLEKRVIADAMRLGAQGYTVHDVRGGNQHSSRDDTWEADRTVKIEIVCSEAAADLIGEHVLRSYGDNFGLTIYFCAAQVLRPAKY